MSDWTTDAADTIEQAVGAVRDRTVVPARAIAKVVAYGVLAGLLVLPAVVILLVGFFRGLVELFQGEVWAAWLVFGGIFLAIGWFLWSRRERS